MRQIDRVGRPLLIAATLTMALSGCAGTNDQQATVGQGVGLGALVGAGIGYAITGRASGALAGAAAGGVIGAGMGSSVADRKAEYARDEDFLVAEIRRNDAFIREAQAQNDDLIEEIAQLDRESRQLAQAYRAGRVTRDDLARQRSQVERQLEKARKINTLAERQLADANRIYGDSRQRRGAQDQYTQQLANNVDQLHNTREQAARNVADLEQVYNHISQG